ncbi:hypothetical protein BJV78DRAFT_202338 [Lactifluus subvellereus]|nr:hypothetical protein BJV78DRAFT_202338 [Lactifluus subvellereus]
MQPLTRPQPGLWNQRDRHRFPYCHHTRPQHPQACPGGQRTRIHIPEVHPRPRSPAQPPPPILHAQTRMMKWVPGKSPKSDCVDNTISNSPQLTSTLAACSGLPRSTFNRILVSDLDTDSMYTEAELLQEHHTRYGLDPPGHACQSHHLQEVGHALPVHQACQAW